MRIHCSEPLDILMWVTRDCSPRRQSQEVHQSSSVLYLLEAVSSMVNSEIGIVGRGYGASGTLSSIMGLVVAWMSSKLLSMGTLHGC